MLTQTVVEAKAHLSDLIRQVELGESVIITSHGKPVVQLTPVSTKPTAPDWLAIRKVREAMPVVHESAIDLIHQVRMARY